MEESLEIESIASPDEVPSMILNGTFDAILANYRMLERNGIEFEERVRRIKDIPFIGYPGPGKEAVMDANLRGAEAQHETDPRHFRILADRLVEAVKKDREIRCQKVSLKVFEALTRGSDLQSTIGEIMRIVREAFGIEAVGIRLQEGEDYPYFVFDGFHDEHILLENELCVTDLEGQLMRDDVGNPVLDCMCGNILRGRFDPSKPFFTEGGSFWTNSTTELLASTTVEDRLVRTRNTCQGEGYESVALIPIRDDGETLGLLQMNDRRPGCFNMETIGFLEGLGKIIGNSLGRDTRGQEALEELEIHRETLRSAPIPSLVIDPDDMSILGASYSAAQMTGIPLEELHGIPCYEALKGYESVCEDYGEECPLMQMLERREQTSTTANPRTGKSGKGGFIEESASPIRGPDGVIELVYLMVREDSGPSRAI
ncbi:MAG: GAF domain-containing protein [Candidatus Bathyarchaeota archaeon]|nr:GAF domain-containing protein [Candidatus Bathyarchaeota archaeon]